MGTTGGSVLNAGPKAEVLMLWGGYGPINGKRTLPRGRLWVIAESVEPDSPLSARVASNDPRTGRPVSDQDVGVVGSARIKTGKWAQVFLADGSTISQTLAPCVCGAGAVGFAGPAEGRHHVRPINPGSHNRVEVV